MKVPILLRATLALVLLAGCESAKVSERPNRGFRPHGGPPVPPIGVVYVVNRSASMGACFSDVRAELKRSIGQLEQDQDEFHVIFFSSGPLAEMPAGRPVPANDANKQKAFKFVDGIGAEGQSDPAKALETAFAVRPHYIYFLTNEKVSDRIIDLARHLNGDQKVTVDAIGFINREAEKSLKRLAAENNGKCRLLTEKDLRERNP